MKTFDEWWSEYTDPRDDDFYSHKDVARAAWNAAVEQCAETVKDFAAETNGTTTYWGEGLARALREKKSSDGHA